MNISLVRIAKKLQLSQLTQKMIDKMEEHWITLRDLPDTKKMADVWRKLENLCKTAKGLLPYFWKRAMALIVDLVRRSTTSQTLSQTSSVKGLTRRVIYRWKAIARRESTWWRRIRLALFVTVWIWAWDNICWELSLCSNQTLYASDGCMVARTTLEQFLLDLKSENMDEVLKAEYCPAIHRTLLSWIHSQIIGKDRITTRNNND